jgi:hypothetical protein
MAAGGVRLSGMIAGPPGVLEMGGLGAVLLIVFPVGGPIGGFIGGFIGGLIGIVVLI